MAKLAANLNNLGENNQSVVVESLYPEIREDIEIDKEAKRNENEFLDMSESSDSENEDDNEYDQLVHIHTKQNTPKRYKSNAQKRSGNANASNEGEPAVEEIDIPDSIPSELREQFQQLLDARNKIKNSIADQEELVNKANENLNEEQFEERCRIQEEKRAKKKHEEQISILGANKISYLKIRSKVTKGHLKEDNLPPLFTDKYCIFRYMEKNKLIDLSSNEEIKDELETYDALYKVIEARELEIQRENDSNDVDSDEDTDYSPIDDVREEFTEICFDFMDYLEQNFPDTQTEKSIHNTLNENVTKLNEIFHRDSDAIEHERENVDKYDEEANHMK